jgi:molybdate/tungstate transport system substrate-binding protein
MLRGMRTPHAVLKAGLVALAFAACSKAPREVVVFHAASLSRPLGEIAEAYQRQNPGVKVHLEPSGSQIAARKVSDQHMAADVVAVADAKVIERILIPGHAKHDIVFATGEIVLAHMDHSRYTAEITGASWPEILRRPEIRLGRPDPDTAPLGYHTILAWLLAERSPAYGESAKGLADALVARCAAASVVHDEAELLGQLESRSLDYAFLYRSTAEDHHLKITLLPADQNLSRPDMSDRYAAVSIDVRMNQGAPKTRIVGAPITYGWTIPSSTPHAAEATRFTAFVIGETGRSVFARRGFRPLAKASCSPCDGIPSELAALVSAAP